MAKHRVVHSVNSDDGRRCVDVFRRPDGTYGFEEYRRDPEDPSGWGGAAGYAGLRFADRDAALHAARAAVPWLAPSPAD